MIFGPVAGYLISMAGLFAMAGTWPRASMLSLHDAYAHFEEMGFRMLLWLIPLALGLLSAAAGAFMTLYALITHFFRESGDAQETIVDARGAARRPLQPGASHRLKREK